MPIRARDILTTLAVAGIGGAIGSFLVGGPRRRRAAPPRASSTEREDEVVILEAELPPRPYAEELFSDAVVEDEPLSALVDDADLDAQPESPMIAAGVSSTAHAPSGAPDDDSPTGENWVESMLIATVEDLPAERAIPRDGEADEPILLDRRR